MILKYIEDYVSEIIDGLYLVIDKQHITLYEYENILVKDNKHTNFIINTSCDFSNESNNKCPICFFINSNDIIKKDIIDFYRRIVMVNTIELYKYFDGWEYTDNYYTFKIKNNKISVSFFDETIIKTQILECYLHEFDIKTWEDFRKNKGLKIPFPFRINENSNERYIYNMLNVNTNTIENLSKYFYTQQLTLNRKELIEDLLDTDI